MLIRIILLLFKIDFESFYNKKIVLIAHVFSTFFSLLIYYYTSKAFSGSLTNSLENYKMNYFSYIVYGELSFMLLGGFVSFSIQRLKMLQIKGVLEQIEFTKTPLETFIVQSSLMSIPREFLIFSVYILIAIFCFDFNVTLISFSALLYFQTLALPLFLGIILLSIAFLIRFGRGSSVSSYFFTFGSFLGGAYFPIDVFPEVLNKYTLYLNPLSALILGVRDTVLTQKFDFFSTNSLIIITWSLIMFCLSILFLRVFQKSIKAKSILVFYGR